VHGIDQHDLNPLFSQELSQQHPVVTGRFHPEKNVGFFMFSLKGSNPLNQPVESSVRVLKREVATLFHPAKILCPGHMDFLSDVCTHDESGFGDLHQLPILLILHLSTSSCCFRVKAILTGGTLFFQNPDSFLNRNAKLVLTGMLSLRVARNRNGLRALTT
jgi:hypothetical protein